MVVDPITEPSRLFFRGPIPFDAVDTLACEPLLRACKRGVDAARELWSGVAQTPDDDPERGARQRRIFADDEIDQRIQSRAALRCIRRPSRLLVRSVDANAIVASRHAQQSAVVHRIEQLGGGARRSPPIVSDGTVREALVDLPRMSPSSLANEVEDRFRAALPSRGPRSHRRARMQQRLDATGQESVVDEIVFFDFEARVSPLEVSRAIVRDAVPQRQVLRACGSPDGIRLDEAERLDRALESRRLEKAAGDSVAAQVVQRDSLGRQYRRDRIAA